MSRFKIVEDTIYDSFKVVRKYKTGFELVDCFHYLTSIRLKHKFARKRLIVLKRKKTYYMKRRVEEYYNRAIRTTWPDYYSILMEFDHCVISLRSSLEHLLQLINLVIPLGLAPQRKSKEQVVGIATVITAMSANRHIKQNNILGQLRENMKELQNQSWYDHLHKLRIEQYHDKFTLPSLVEHRSKEDSRLYDITWNIPGLSNDKTGTTHIDIVNYCESTISNVEEVLITNLELLNKYMG